jgi:hypothetical protein
MLDFEILQGDGKDRIDGVVMRVIGAGTKSAVGCMENPEIFGMSP